MPPPLFHLNAVGSSTGQQGPVPLSKHAWSPLWPPYMEKEE